MDTQQIREVAEEISISPEYQGLASFVALIERGCRPFIVKRNRRSIKILFRLLKMNMRRKMKELSSREKMILYRAIRERCPAFSKSFSLL